MHDKDKIVSINTHGLERCRATLQSNPSVLYPLTLSGAKKFSFRQIRFILGWRSKLKLNDGLNAWAKAIGEDPRNLLYFMPWA